MKQLSWDGSALAILAFHCDRGLNFKKGRRLYSDVLDVLGSVYSSQLHSKETIVYVGI